VEDCYVSIFGTIQPAVVNELFRDGEKDGMTARVGLAVCPQFPEQVDFVDQQPRLDIRKAVEARLREMRDCRACDDAEAGRLFTEDGKLPISRVLRFSGEAYAIFEQWWLRNANRPERRDGSSFGIHIAKYPALFARLALAFHFMEHGAKAPREVSAKTAANV